MPIGDYDCWLCTPRLLIAGSAPYNKQLEQPKLGFRVVGSAALDGIKLAVTDLRSSFPGTCTNDPTVDPCSSVPSSPGISIPEDQRDRA
jgi:hypothetical protein